MTVSKGRTKDETDVGSKAHRFNSLSGRYQVVTTLSQKKNVILFVFVI